MPTAIAGRGGSVRINGTPPSTIALVNQWSAQASTNIYDSTSLGETWRQGVVGFRSMTGTIQGSWAVTTDAGQTALHNAFVNGTSFGLVLTVNGNDAPPGDGYEMLAFLTNFTVTVAVASLVTFSAQFQNQGTVSVN